MQQSNQSRVFFRLAIVGIIVTIVLNTTSAQPPRVERVEVGPLSIELGPNRQPAPPHVHPAPQPPPPRIEEAKRPMKATVYDGHFVKNTFIPEKGGSFLVFRDFSDFDNVFGAGAVMGGRQKFVTEETFKDNAVLVVIRDGLWTFDVKSVDPTRDGPVLEYTAARKNTNGNARFVTPLVVSLPEEIVRDGMVASFIENGRPVAKVKVERRDLPGGWTEYRPMEKEWEHVFENAIRRERLEQAGYQPLLCATQVVAGIKYRFLCVSMPERRHQKEKVAVISVYTGPHGKIESVKVASVSVDD